MTGGIGAATEPITGTVHAVLGPTNTGKTHYAIERMVSHRSGVIGLPLRLLAREIYGRVAEKVGAQNVALVTGEEKITPPFARYQVCTVEALPKETNADFVAIDEAQLAADMERGHIFTDRVLNLRGRGETLLLGSDTAAGILKKLIPGIVITSRPRLSTLSYAGEKKITRLPPRSAIIAFSADEVYAIAELIRRQRGGAAVVLGALSPRTRNAQVELYQSGDVAHLVATDAVGMGLNLDVDHVAFAQNWKFDGHQFRELTPAEFGQIAGRAGRYTRDGTFGVTGRVPPLDDELVERLQTHSFEPVRTLQWRSPDHDFSSVEALLASLDVTPRVEGLTRALPATDHRALMLLSRDEMVLRHATSAANVKRLWEVCALPDYRKIAPAQHADIIAQLYRDLCRRGRVDEAYMDDQVKRADVTDGEIDTLSARIAQIRTWTYVSHRPNWLADPTHWQEKTRAIEDRLSDALHERLTKRFVDRRTTVLMKRLRENAMLEAYVGFDGSVTVEGHPVGVMQGFRFSADATAGGPDAKAVQAAALKALALEFEARAARFAIAPNGDLALGTDAIVRWLGAPVAQLAPSEDWLKPRAVLLADEQLTGPSRDRVQHRIDRFVAHHIETQLKPLLELQAAEQLQGFARGLAFRLVENGGLVERKTIAEEMKSLDQTARAALRRLGVRFGFYYVFLPALLKPAPAEAVTLLWSLKHGLIGQTGQTEAIALLAAGRTSFVIDPAIEPVFYRLAGFAVLGPRGVRFDILERLADQIRPALYWKEGVEARPEAAFGKGAFFVTPGMMSILGATHDDMAAVLSALGYRGQPMQKPEFETKLAAVKLIVPANAPAVPDAPKFEVVIASPHKVDAAAITAQTAMDGDGAGASDEAASVESEANDAQPAGDGAPAEVSIAGNGAVAAAPAIEATTPEMAPMEALAAETPAEEAKPVLIWRVARAERTERPDRPQHNRGPRRDGRPVAADGEAQPREGKPKFDRSRFQRPPGQPAPVGEGRGDGQRPGGKPRFDKGRAENGRGENGRPANARGDGSRSDKPRFDNSSFQKPKFDKPKAEKPIDPDSPFAKLAALKERMKGG
ncbi:MAG: helicase [Rhizobiaceae bacterium]|jgi:ATP-dependent RNA helicase SUPV3L1/SUV3|nr:helicase [Rhizobiaceae bacterium]